MSDLIARLRDGVEWGAHPEYAGQSAVDVNTTDRTMAEAADALEAAQRELRRTQEGREVEQSMLRAAAVDISALRAELEAQRDLTVEWAEDAEIAEAERDAEAALADQLAHAATRLDEGAPRARETLRFVVAAHRERRAAHGADA